MKRYRRSLVGSPCGLVNVCLANKPTDTASIGGAVIEARTNRQTDGPMDGWMDGWTDGRMDGRTDRQTEEWTGSSSP